MLLRSQNFHYSHSHSQRTSLVRLRAIAGAGHIFSISRSHYSDINGAAQSQPSTTRHYNEAIRSLSRRRTTAEEAILLYPQIRLHGLHPDAYTFTFALKAAAALSAVKIGKQIHCQSIKAGLDVNLYTRTALVQMYASVGRMGSAQKMFDEMSERNVVAWTTLISAYVHMKRPQEAIAVFRRMLADDVEPDEVAMTAVLSACSDLGVLELGEWIHGYVAERGIRRTVSFNNALIDMYSKSGQIRKALEVFEEFESKNIVTWTTMISGLAFHGLAMEAREMFTRMEKANEKPNDVTFLALLSACNHAGLVELGRHYFHKMNSAYNINPNIKHYACFVALLSRAGQLQEAEELARSMPFKANAAVWGPLLAASRIYGDAELAARAADYLFSLEPKNSGNYLLLSNTYAALGRWDEAARARKVLRDARARARGVCRIEVDGVIHVFAACDLLHPRVEEVYDVLQWIYRGLKVACFDQMEDGEYVKFGEQNGDSDDLL